MKIKIDKLQNTYKDIIYKLKKSRNNIPSVMKDILERATYDALETAINATPPTEGDSVRGTGMITGNLKSAWSRDSIKESIKRDNKYITVLANNEHYASYVNDGHRLDKHFVPGLIINPYSGLLEKSPDGKGGIMVGTKTNYIPGKYMKEQAIETFKETLKKESVRILNVLDNI